MSIKEELLKEHSKANTQKIVRSIGTDQVAFDELMELFFDDDYRVAQRAAWVVSHAVDGHPWLIKNHMHAMIQNLKLKVHDAVKRNTLRVLQFVDISEEDMGECADLCFGFLRSGSEPIAVRAHAMTVLFNITKVYPELGDELRLAIEDLLPFGSAGIKSRGKRIIRELDKMTK